MRIKALMSYPYSTLIIFEPRFYLVNNLNIPIKYRQISLANVVSDIVYKLNTKQTKLITYKEEEIKVDKYHKEREKIYFQFCCDWGINLNEIGIGNNLSNSSILNENKELWSQIFDINIFADFNVSILLPKGFNHNIENTLIHSYDGQNFYMVIRVIIQTIDGGLTHIVITNPNKPQFFIKNFTNENIIIKQIDSFQNINITQGYIGPYCLADLRIRKKCVELYFNNLNIKKIIDLNMLEAPFEIQTLSGNKIYVSVEVENNHYTRTIKLQDENYLRNVSKLTYIKEAFYCRKTKLLTNCSTKLKGLGISIIDGYPRELVYISVYDIEIKESNYNTKSSFLIKNTHNIELYIKNFQIDYCLFESFPLIIFPRIQMLEENQIEIMKNNKKIIPVIQAVTTLEIIENLIDLKTNIIIKQVDFTMQELITKFDQMMLNNILIFAKAVKDLFASDESINNNVNPDFQLEDFFSADIVTLNKVISFCDDYPSILVEAVTLSVFKILLTVNINTKYFEIVSFPKMATNIVGTFAYFLATITNGPLRISENQIGKTFININVLFNTLKRYYTQQSLVQLYLLIGGADLITNPRAFMENVGEALEKTFTEPRKYFIQGPIELGEKTMMGENIRKSNKCRALIEILSFVSSFGLAGFKKLLGDKMQIKEEDEPENIKEGISNSIKGGAKEVYNRFRSLFVNTYVKTKQDKVRGFFKGFCRGLGGVILTPFTCCIKSTSICFTGCKNDKVFYEKGKVNYSRFRYPKFAMPNQVLINYESKSAEVKYLLRKKLKNFKNFKVIYVTSLNLKNSTWLIITNEFIIEMLSHHKEINLIENRLIRTYCISNTDNINLNRIVFHLTNKEKKSLLVEDLDKLKIISKILDRMYII